MVRTLGREAQPLVDLRREVGSPPQTTMRKHLRVLARLGVIEKTRQDGFPGALEYELTGPGQEFLEVARVLQGWLKTAPDGPLTLGSLAAKNAIKALVDGWSTTLVRALVGKPLSLTELDALIAGLSYPSLERRLLAMRLTGQVEPIPDQGRSTPYVVTDWLRRAVGPLAAAARWEGRYVAAETAPITPLDIEGAFLLAAPLLQLQVERSGLCRLAVEASNGSEPRLAGALVGVEEGRVAYCRARLEGDATAWISGSASAWLRAVIDHENDKLEMGGDCHLARDVLEGMGSDLCRVRERDGSPSAT